MFLLPVVATAERPLPQNGPIGAVHAPQLQIVAGFGVIVPAQLTAGGQRRLQLRLRIGEDEAPLAPKRKGAKIAGVVAGASALGMEQLTTFRWQAAIGDWRTP